MDSEFFWEPDWLLAIDYLAGIHDVLRVQRGLDRPHRSQRAVAVLVAHMF